MCHVGEVAPLEVARETAEIRVDGKGRELVLIVTQHGAVYHQVIHHPHAHKRSTSRRLKYCATCMYIRHNYVTRNYKISLENIVQFR
jgi:hypothetical protein